MASKRKSDEQAVQSSIQLAATRAGCRLWRNNVGALMDERGRLVRYGLCPGSSDLVGLVPVRVTPEMVGQTIAVFAAVEVKDRGQPTEQQQAFINLVRAMGGRAGVARSREDALQILNVVG